jgi:methylenetetrahydrofolate reductase (NADPH)
LEHTSNNPLRAAITTGKFCYMVELVASAKSTEAAIGDIATGIAGIPGVVAAGVTSYAGGSAGHDPIRISEIVKERGLTPNVHMTCVSRNRVEMDRDLRKVHALGIETVFAITGDYPGDGDRQNPTGFDMDSVQLVEMISEFKAAGFPFFTSVAISPFKYTEADCAYQYLKLEKKIAAGADFAISQLGYDMKKNRELKRYLDERRLKTPVLGNVYLLPLRAAEKFSKGEPPGCWAAPELVEKIREEAKAEDKGMAARLERGARMVAVLRGLGFAGAYLGGDHNADRLRWVIERSESIAANWEEYYEEISYSPKNGFFFFESPKAAPKPKKWFAKVADPLAATIDIKHKDTILRRAAVGLFGWIDKHPALARTMEQVELAGKKPLFGCISCGNCVLGEMEYVCPMTCPKNLRNGPCGGTFNGQCEVKPEMQCIWVQVYENAKSAGRVNELKLYLPPRNRDLQGTSSFINLFLDRAYRPGHTPPLIQIESAPAPAAQIK